MKNTLYVGIDVSKDKLDVAYTTDGVKILSNSIFTNEVKSFKSLLKQTEKNAKGIKFDQIHFCMEATGIYHVGISEFLQESTKHTVSVINPIKTKAFSKSLMLRTKNDKIDSSMLAIYGYIHNPPNVRKTPDGIKEFRALIRYQQSLVESRTREITRLKSTLNNDVKKFIENKLSFIEHQITEVINLIKNLIKTDEFLTKQIKLLKTIDGIGDKVAWTLISELKFDEMENISPKAQVAHAGLSPREFSSGSSVRGRSHISRMGNSSIRRVLFLPALGCIKNHNYFSNFYLRLINNGKPKKVAITAVMRKMVLTAAGVLKNQQPFTSDWSFKIQEKYQESLNIA